MGCGVCSKKASRRYGPPPSLFEREPLISASPAAPSFASTRGKAGQLSSAADGPLVCLSVPPSHEALASSLAEELTCRLRASSRLSSLGATDGALCVKLAPLGVRSTKAPPSCDVLVPLLTPEWLQAPNGILLLRSAQRLRALGLGPELLPLLHLAAFGKQADALARALSTPAGELLRQVAAPGSWGRFDSHGKSTQGIEAAVSWLVSRIEGLVAAPGIQSVATVTSKWRNDMQSWRRPGGGVMKESVQSSDMPPQLPSPSSRKNSKQNVDLEGMLAAALSGSGPEAVEQRGQVFQGQPLSSHQDTWHDDLGGAGFQPNDFVPGRWADNTAWAGALRQEQSAAHSSNNISSAEAAFGAAWADMVRQDCGKCEPSFVNYTAHAGHDQDNVQPSSLQSAPVPTRESLHLLPLPPHSLGNNRLLHKTFRGHALRAAPWRPRDTFRAHSAAQQQELPRCNHSAGSAHAGFAHPQAKEGSSSSAPPTPRGRAEGWDHFSLGELDHADFGATSIAAFVKSAPSSPRGMHGRDTEASWSVDPFSATMRETQTCWGSTASYMGAQFARSRMSESQVGWGWPVHEELPFEDDAWQKVDEVDTFTDALENDSPKDSFSGDSPKAEPRRRCPLIPQGMAPLPSLPQGDDKGMQPAMGMTYASPFGGGQWPKPPLDRPVLEGHFGRFSIGSALPSVGSDSGGSMESLGVKYASMDCNLNRRVVVWHFVAPDWATAAERVKLDDALAAGIDSLKEVRHARLCPYLACERIQNELYVVQGYAPGGSVADWLQDAGHIDDAPAQRIACAALEGLEHLHCQHLMAHGSVRGGNVLLGPGAAVRLGDFGLGTVLQRRRICGGQMGGEPRRLTACPAPWRAPELTSDEDDGPTSSIEGDVWAFGCLLISMLAGCSVSSQAGSLSMDAARLPLLAKHLSPKARDMAHQCLQNSPLHRPAVTQLSKDPWIAWLPHDSELLAETR